MATLTWVAAAAGLASDGLNWSGGVAPMTGDDVVFDGTSVNNCSWDLDASVVTVHSLTLATGYTGTLTQGDVDIGIGAGGLVQQDGILIGNKFRMITSDGSFIVTNTPYRTISLCMTGQGNILSFPSYFYSLKIEGDTQAVSKILFDSLVVGNEVVFTVSEGMRCVTYATLFSIENNGIITGTGTFEILIGKTDVEVSLRNVSIPVAIYYASGAAPISDKTIRCDINIENNLTVYSQSPNYTLSLDLNGHSLTADGVTVGTRGNILWGENVHRIGGLDTSAGSSDFESSQVIMTGGSIKLGAGQAFHDLEFEAPVTLNSNVGVGGYLYFPKYINYNGYSVTVDPANIVEAIPIATFERDGIKVTKGQFDSVAAASLSVNGADFATKAATWDGKQDALANAATLATYSQTEANLADAVTKKHSHANATALNAVSGTNTGDETQATIKSKLGAATTTADGYMTAAQVTALGGKQDALSGDVATHYHSADRNLSSLNMDGDKDFLGVAINNPGLVDGVDVGSHTHSGAAGSGAKINLKDVEVTADKDMAGKTLSNVGIDAKSVAVRGNPIDPTRVNNDIMLWDGQEQIDNGDLTLVSEPDKATHFKEVNEAEFSSYLRINGRANITSTQVGPSIRVTPGEKLYIQFSGRTPEESEVNGTIHPYIEWYDENEVRLDFYNPGPTTYNKGEPWKKTVRSAIVPSNARFIRPKYAVNFYPATAITDVANVKAWRDANFDSDLSAKNISADAVIIKDGGTVDGVDISTHNHDGTAIGGPKIPWDNIDITSGVKLKGYSLSGAYDIGATNKVDTVKGYNVAGVEVITPTRAIVNVPSINGATINAAKAAEWDGKADGSIFTPAKAAEWDGKASGSIFTPEKAAEWDGKLDRVPTIPSDTIRHSHDSISGLNGSKIHKTITFTENGPTKARITYEVKGTNDTFRSYAEVRKNDVPIGTRFEGSGTTYQTITQDLTLDIKAGDKIQLWAGTSNEKNTTYVQNLRIKYDIGYSSTVNS